MTPPPEPLETSTKPVTTDTESPESQDHPRESSDLDSTEMPTTPTPNQTNPEEEPVVSVWGMMPSLIVLSLAAGAWIGAMAGWFDDRSVDYVIMAEKAMADEDYNLARLCYTRLVEQRGNMPDDLRGLALAMLRQGDVQAAGALRDYLTPSDLAELMASDRVGRSANPNQGDSPDPLDDPRDWNHSSRLELARVQIETDDFEKAALTLEPGWRVTRFVEYRKMLARLYLAWFDRAQRLDLTLPADFWERVVVHLADHEDLQPMIWRRLAQDDSPAPAESNDGRESNAAKADSQTVATPLWDRLTRLARGIPPEDETELDDPLVARVGALCLGAARRDDLNDVWPTARAMIEAVPSTRDQGSPSLKAARLWLRLRLEPDSAADLQERLAQALDGLEGSSGVSSRP